MNGFISLIHRGHAYAQLRPYLLAAIVVCAALAASTLLLPDSKELALMRMKDERFEEAQRDYEAQLAQGELTLDAANQLSDIYLKTGKVDKAISVMESFVAAFPNHVEARVKLGKLYQYGERQGDYIRNLEILNRLQPTSETLTSLSQFYNASKQYDKQIEMLKQLIRLESGKNPAHYLDLANVYLAMQNYAEAIGALRDLHRLHPAQFTFKEAELLIRMLLDNKQPDEASKEAHGWADTRHNSDEGAILAALLHFKANAERSMALIKRFTDTEIDSNGALLEQYVLAAGELRQEEEAYARLKALHNAGRLPANVQKYALFMAASRKEYDVLRTLTASVDLSGFSEAELLSLTEIALAGNMPDMTQLLAERFPAEEYGERYPLFIAALAVANRYDQAEERLKRLEQHSLTASQSLHIARICAQVHNDECTAHFIDAVQHAEGLSDAEISDIAALYFKLDRQDKGYMFVMNAMKTRPTPALKATAMQYAAARDEKQTVLTWLKDNPNAVPQTIYDLFYAAYNHNHYALALSIAELADARFASPQSRGILIEAYLRNGFYEDALELLRKQSPRSAQDENNYINALSHASRGNSAYRRELGEYAQAMLASDSYDKQEKIAMVYTLVNANAGDYALPYIRILADTEGGEWVSYYADTLDSLGQHIRARDYWLKLAASPDTETSQKMAIASVLMAHGYKQDALALYRTLAADKSIRSKDKLAIASLLLRHGQRHEALQLYLTLAADPQLSAQEKYVVASLLLTERYPNEAETILLQLAKDAPPNSDAVRALLYLWGNGPNPKAQAWLQMRYRQASAAEQPAWALLISYASDDTAFAAFVHATPQARQQSELLQRYVGILVAQGMLAEQAESLAHESMEQGDPDSMLLLAKAIAQENMRPLARTVLDAILANDPANINALREAGIVAFSQGEYSHAKAYFNGYLQHMPDYDRDAPRIFYHYALILRREGDTVTAHTYFQAALDVLNAHEQDDASAAVLRAQLYQALGDLPKALHIMQEAQERYPNNAMLRADYVSMLLDAKQYEAAYDALEQPIAYENEGVRKRYALLQARAAMDTGQRYDAGNMLTQLAADYPQDAQILTMLASNQYNAGNGTHAAALLEKAKAIAPENEDINHMLRDVKRSYASGISLEYDIASLGDDREHIRGIRTAYNYNNRWQAGAQLQQNDVTVKAARRSDGRTGYANELRTRGEIYVQYEGDVGKRFKAALFANNDTPGIGGYYHFLNDAGATQLTAEWHKPYWELSGAVLDSATRDKLGINHYLQINPQLTLSGGLGIQRYHTEARDNVLSTGEITLEALYTLRDAFPYLAIGYGFDGEYQLAHRTGPNATGMVSRIFPLLSREVHFLSLNASYDLNDATAADMMFGYGYDRLGGQGPTAMTRLRHQFNEHFDAQLRLLYGMDNTSSANSTTRIGGNVRWRF